MARPPRPSWLYSLVAVLSWPVVHLVYRLRVTLALTGDLTDAQRQELLAVAGKCPLHKLMTQVTTEIVTELAAPASQAGT